MANPAETVGERIPQTDTEKLTSAVFEISRIARDAGWISERTFDKLDVTTRSRYSGKISKLRMPVELISAHEPRFVINGDVFGSLLKEFSQLLSGPLGLEQTSKNLAISYASAASVGEFILRRHITDPSYERTPARLRVISEVMNNRTDFTDHFKVRFGDEELKKLMENIDDAAAIQINGLRAGLTIVRAATQEVYDTDFLSDDLVLACNAALEAYVAENGPYYVGLAEYLNLPSERGVGAFSYAVPEWLYVMAVPMPTERVMQIFDQRFVSKIGPVDEQWTPTTGLEVE